MQNQGSSGGNNEAPNTTPPTSNSSQGYDDGGSATSPVTSPPNIEKNDDNTITMSTSDTTQPAVVASPSSSSQQPSIKEAERSFEGRASTAREPTAEEGTPPLRLPPTNEDGTTPHPDDDHEVAHLTTYDKIPLWQKDNPYILGYYRVHYSTRQCLKSVFQIHNETTNVWTHLIGVLLFIPLIIYAFTGVIAVKAAEHYIVVSLYCIGAMICMGCSTVFHLFTGHVSSAMYQRMRSFDYFGITVQIVFSFIPACYYGFVCHPGLKWGYLAMIGTLGMGGILGPLFNIFHTHCFRWPRLLIYVTMVISGFFPLIHSQIVIEQGEQRVPIVTGLLLMFALYGAGVLIYALRIPERFMPGKCDIWIHSHMIWHCFVLAAAVTHFFTTMSLYRLWEELVVDC